MIRLFIVVAIIFLFPSTFVLGQPFEHHYQEGPSADASVIVISTRVSTDSVGSPIIRGRVFNRGLKEAKNVRVVFEVRNTEGVVLARGASDTVPGNIPPSHYADFQERILWRFDPHRDLVTTVAKWYP